MAAKKQKTEEKLGRRFSFMEDLGSETNEPHLHRHFRDALKELAELESWMKQHRIRNNWTLTEKLAFLRNVEARIRTNSAIRRTELAWWAFTAGIALGLVGFAIGILAGS